MGKFIDSFFRVKRKFEIRLLYPSGGPPVIVQSALRTLVDELFFLDVSCRLAPRKSVFLASVMGRFLTHSLELHSNTLLADAYKDFATGVR